MRNFVAGALAVAMITTGALAATDSGTPLPPGKQAGVARAQSDDNMVWYGLIAGFVIAGIVLVAENGNSTLTSGSTTTTTTTTTR